MDIPYLPALKIGSPHSGPIIRLVVHSTSPGLAFGLSSARGMAIGTARYFQTPGAGGSAHYVHDVAEDVQCVPEGRIAAHAPPNDRSIGFEVCGESYYTREQWLSPKVWPAAVRCANNIKAVAARRSIPLRLLTTAQVRAGMSGICGHANVSDAFGKSDHHDPGPGFPWDVFMALLTDSKEWYEMSPIPDADLAKIAGAILAAKVNNPITGKPASVATYLNSINANAYSARLDAAAARKVAEAQAAAGRPLTAAEIEAAAKAGVDAALDDRIGEATVKLNVTGGAK